MTLKDPIMVLGPNFSLAGATATVMDNQNRNLQPPHLIGVTLDSFQIYRDKDMNGQTIAPNRLDACNGITIPTPEFPQGFCSVCCHPV